MKGSRVTIRAPNATSRGSAKRSWSVGLYRDCRSCRLPSQHTWWTQAIPVGTSCSQNCRNSARLLSSPRTTATMSPQVLQHRNWGKDSTFHDQGDILPMCTTQVSRTNTILYHYSHLTTVFNLCFSKKSSWNPRPRRRLEVRRRCRRDGTEAVRPTRWSDQTGLPEIAQRTLSGGAHTRLPSAGRIFVGA